MILLYIGAHPVGVCFFVTSYLCTLGVLFVFRGKPSDISCNEKTILTKYPKERDANEKIEKQAFINGTEYDNL